MGSPSVSANGNGTAPPPPEKQKEAQGMAAAADDEKEAYMEKNSDFGAFAIEYPKIQGTSEDVEVFWPASMNNENALVVVLLGWAGAQDKHLAKYSDIYLSRG